MTYTNNMTSSRGVVFITLSAMFYASYGIWSKLMTGVFGEFTQAWTRGLVILILILLANIRFHFLKPIKRTDLPWFIVIGLCGGLNQAPYYFGFEHLPIGTAIILFYASLVVVGYILGKLFFAEKLGPTKLVSLTLALIGMVTIYQFSLAPNQIIPAIAMILAGSMGSTAVVSSKKLSGTYSEAQIILTYSIFTIAANSILALIFQESIPGFNHLTAWMGQLGYLVAYLTANIAVIEGFRHLEPSVGSIIGLTEIIFGFVYGIILFNEPITTSTIIGGSVILLATALPNLPELILSRRQLNSKQ